MFTRKNFEDFIRDRYPEAIFEYPDDGKEIFWIPGKELQFYRSTRFYEADFDSVGSCYVSSGKLVITFDF